MTAGSSGENENHAYNQQFFLLVQINNYQNKKFINLREIRAKFHETTKYQQKLSKILSYQNTIHDIMVVLV